MGRSNKKLILVILFCLILLIILDMPSGPAEKNVRKPAVAGTWYPGTEQELSSMIEGYFDESVTTGLTDIKALIVPHAGYVYSGQVAAEGFAQLTDNYDTVFILGSNHNGDAPFFKFSVPNFTHYKTPLGEVPVSGIVLDLMAEDLFEYVPEAHKSHIIEIELPFLQKKLSDFDIIPLVTGYVNSQDLKKAADIIEPYVDEDTLIVVSSDLSHYHSYDDAVSMDTSCIKAIEAQNLAEVNKCEACGLAAMKILLELAARKGWKAKIIEYKNSGDTSGQKDRVVGYSSIAFYKEEFTSAEKKLLLNIARNTLEKYVKDGTRYSPEEEIPERLKKEQGCFVTLEKNHNLRGCIGHIIPQEPLYECVIDNAINAAVNDRRFPEVEPGELDDIEIEISALSVPDELYFENPEDLLNKLRPGIDGVILRSGFFQSTFLPQVWEDLPDKEDFLSRLCMKAGLTGECWKTNIQVSTYQAEVWSESESGEE